MKKVLLRLSGSLVAVLGLWTLVWLPLVLGQSSAAEPTEYALGDPQRAGHDHRVRLADLSALRAFPEGRAAQAQGALHRPGQGPAGLSRLPARPARAGGERACPLRRPRALFRLPRRPVPDPGELGGRRRLRRGAEADRQARRPDRGPDGRLLCRPEAVRPDPPEPARRPEPVQRRARPRPSSSTARPMPARATSTSSQA